MLNSPLADPKVKGRADKEVAKNPREVGFFQAIADLKLSGFETQIEAGMNWDNAELVIAAKAAKAAVGGAGHGGKKVAELAIPEVAEAAMSGKGDVAAGTRLFTAQGCIAGQVSRVKRADVAEESHLPNSMMPPGLAAGLTVEEFTSLVGYLVSLKSTGG